MGRKTFEVAGRRPYPGLRTYVFSRTLRPEDFPGVTIVSAEEAASTVAALRAEEGEDVWLCGGGELCGSLLEAGLVDTVGVGLSEAETADVSIRSSGLLAAYRIGQGDHAAAIPRAGADEGDERMPGGRAPELDLVHALVHHAES